MNPANSAPMVAWLASDDALHVTGQVFRAVGPPHHPLRALVASAPRSSPRASPPGGSPRTSAPPSTRTSSTRARRACRWAAEREPRLGATDTARRGPGRRAHDSGRRHGGRATTRRTSMASVWSYEGKRVLVSGGGGAGMGAAAVRDLLELGAEVHVFDVKEPDVGRGELPVRRPARPRRHRGRPWPTWAARSTRCSIPRACPARPFSGLDAMLVNFVAARHLTSLAAPHMAAGLGRGHHLLGRRPSGGRTSWTRWRRSSPPPATPRAGSGARSTPPRWARATCCPSRPSSSGPCTPRSTSPPRGSG